MDIATTTSTNSPFSIVGWLSEQITFGIESPPAYFSRSERELTSVETSLFTRIDWQPAADLNFRFSATAYHDAVYSINEDTDYSTSERNTFRNRIEVRDFYLEKQFDNDVYLKVGNQILAWGFAEYLRVTDIVNPENQYTVGQQDLEEIRLQVPAALASFNAGDWVLDGVVTVDAGYHDYAPAGDEFDQLILLRSGDAQVHRHGPQKPLELFFRASTHYTNGDIQIVIGDFNNNQLSLDGIDEPMSVTPIVNLSQERIQALGLAANRSAGNWLWFGEVGYHTNTPLYPVKTESLAQAGGWEERDLVLGVLGLEYNGLRNTLVSLEADSIYIRNHEDSLNIDQYRLSVGARGVWTGLNDRLQLTSVWNRFASDQGYVTRVAADFDWTDNLNIGLLWVDYHGSSDSLYYAYRNNDILQFNIRYSFQR